MTDDSIDPELPDAGTDPQSSADAAKGDPSDRQDSGRKNDGKKTEAKTELSASEVLASLKTSLGSSYTSDTAESEDRMSGYYGLDMSRIESWAAESNASSSLNADCAVVLKVKDGYAQDAAALLQQSFDQVVELRANVRHGPPAGAAGAPLHQRELCRPDPEGAKPDGSASAEEQAKFAAGEAAKVDAAWKAHFRQRRATPSSSRRTSAYRERRLRHERRGVGG